MNMVKPDNATILMQNGATGTENGISVPVNKAGVVGVQVLGVSGDAITFEGTVNGVDWVSVRAKNVSTGTIATTVTSNGVYLVGVMGLTELRARISAYVGGTITVIGQRLAFPLDIQETATFPVSQEFNVNQWDEASSTLTYVGLSTTDGVWYIKKVDSAAKTIGHATANNNPSYITFAAAWAARTSLTYGRFDEAF
jgi:hypothetical protein